MLNVSFDSSAAILSFPAEPTARTSLTWYRAGRESRTDGRSGWDFFEWILGRQLTVGKLVDGFSVNEKSIGHSLSPFVT